MPINVAFYTTGDPNPAVPNQAFNSASRQEIEATVSNLYELFAFNHARVVFAADGISTAIEQMQSLEAGSVRNFYFIGHGNHGIYAFRVTPGAGGHVFINTMGETLGWGGTISPLHQRFINEIVRVADRTQRVSVNFFSCFTANGDLLQEISRALRTAQIPHVVSGTQHYWDLVGRAVLRGRQWTVGYRETGRLEVNLRH